MQASLNFNIQIYSSVCMCAFSRVSLFCVSMNNCLKSISSPTVHTCRTRGHWSLILFQFHWTTRRSTNQLLTWRMPEPNGSTGKTDEPKCLRYPKFDFHSPIAISSQELCRYSDFSTFRSLCSHSCSGTSEISLCLCEHQRHLALKPADLKTWMNEMNIPNLVVKGKGKFGTKF